MLRLLGWLYVVALAVTAYTITAVYVAPYANRYATRIVGFLVFLALYGVGKVVWHGSAEIRQDIRVWRLRRKLRLRERPPK